MKLIQLQKLFKNLPSDFVKEINEQDFKVCWYGSAGIDKRPMELFDSSHPDALIDETVKIFFYTDIGYVTFVENLVFDHSKADFENGTHYGYRNCGGILKGSLNNNQIEFEDNIRSYIHKNNYENYKGKFNTESMSVKMKALFDVKKNNLNDTTPNFVLNEMQSSLIEMGLSTFDELKTSFEEDQRKKMQEQVDKIKEVIFVENYIPGARLVRHKRTDGVNIYCFYIDCDDWTFEKLLIQENIKINYVAHWGGWAGPGPRCLGNLQVEYGIGFIQSFNDECDFNVIPHKLENIKEFNWRKSSPDERSLYRIII